MDNDNTRFHIDTICATIVPFVLKRFALISTSWYYVLLAIGFIATIAFAILRKIGIVRSYKPAIMSFAIMCATSLCLVISSNMRRNAESERLHFNLNTTFRESYEAAANKGDVNKMVTVGAYYAFTVNQSLIPAPKGDIRDDELMDTRDFIKARRFLKMAIEQNSADAYVLLGEMELQGLGCVPSRKQALEYFNKANEIDSNNGLLLRAMELHGITYDSLHLVK